MSNNDMYDIDIFLVGGEPVESKVNRNKKKTYDRKVPNQLYIEMGKRLRMFRNQLDYTQEQMADILGMSVAYYGKVERGVHGLSLAKLVIVNDKLDIDINYLLTGVEKSNLSLDNVLNECPREKRYDMEQLIKYAVSLAGKSDK